MKISSFLPVLSLAKKILYVDNLTRWINFWVRKVSSWTHELQFYVDWAVDNPEHFDHFIDLNFQWNKTRASFPMERGVFSSFALQRENRKLGRTLDLCCGDGFYTKYFYSLLSSEVVGIDFDSHAIKWARRNNKSDNIQYILGDVRTNFPTGEFDNIMWDAAIEHFNENEIHAIMNKIKMGLAPNGVLSGYTIKENDDVGKHLHQHEYEFRSMEDLTRFLTPFFENVKIIETVFPMRTNFYFYASDGVLPFEGKNVLTTRLLTED